MRSLLAIVVLGAALGALALALALAGVGGGSADTVDPAHIASAEPEAPVRTELHPAPPRPEGRAGVEAAPGRASATPAHESAARATAPVEPEEPEAPVLVLRVLDEVARPLANVAVRTRLLAGTTVSWASGSTDAHGRLRIPVSSKPPETVELVHDDARGARLRVPERLAPGENDLGDVRLTGIPLIASGVVQSPWGVPVPGTRLMMMTVLRADGRVDRTLSPAFQAAVTGEDGRFAFHGWAEDATHVQLSAHHPAAAETGNVEAPLGTTGLIVTVSGGGSIAGLVLTDGEATRRVVRVAAKRDGAESWRKPAGLMPEGKLLLPQLPEGTYTVRVTTEADETPLAVVTGVEVRAGERARPRELDPLDVRDLLRRHEITVVDHAGVPLDATVYYRAAGAALPWAPAGHRADAPAVIHTASETIDVTATPKEHGWAERSGVSGAATLVCGPTYEVHLRLDAPVEAEISARLLPQDYEQRSGMSSESARFDGRGVSVLRAKGVGPHQVLLSTERGTISVRDAPVIDVRGSFGPQELVVAVPPAFREAARKDP